MTSMIPPLLSALQAIAPDDCVITGSCGGPANQVGPGSGLMFLAIGLLALGGWSWWSARRRPAGVGGRNGPPSHVKQS
jgi:hypothetical protein